jgi:glycosyltransferase involved in cell wall biosynthesis
LGWSAVSLAETLHIPVVADFHTNFHSYGQHYGWGFFSSVIYRYLRHFHNRANLTLVPTRSMRERLEADGFRRVEVVSRGVDTELFSPKRRDPSLRLSWGLGPDDVAVLYVGRIAAEKNLPVVVQAFEAMKRIEPRAKLILVGSGPLLEALKQDKPDYIYAGVQRGETLAQYYASSDVFLFPSLTETFGNVTLEAMASGLAVVAYNYAAAAEHMVAKESGLPVPFDDTSAFVKAAEDLAASALLRARVRQGAVDVCARLGWTEVMDELEFALARTVYPEKQTILVHTQSR